MEEYRDLFLAEAREYLQSMTEHLLEMEKDPGDTGHLTEIFRSAHSLKGMAGTMGYEIISGLTHKMENLLDSLRGGRIQVNTEMVNLLFEAVDQVQLLVDNLDSQEEFQEKVTSVEQKLLAWLESEQNGAETAAPGPSPTGTEKQTKPEPEPGDAAPVPGDAASVQEEDAAAKPDLNAIFNDYEKEMLRDASAKGEAVIHIHVYLLEGSLLKSVRAYMVYKAVEEQGDVIKTEPPVQELEEGQFDRDFYMVVMGHPDLDELRKAIEGIAEVERVDFTPLKIEGEEQAELDGAAAPDVAEAASAAAAPDTVPGTTVAAAAAAESVAAAGKTEQEAETQKPRQAKGAAPARAAEKTVRVETAKLDTLVNLVGELIINRTRVLELGKQVENESMEGALEQLERITSDLQSAVMTLRMVPIKQVFDRFPRMVRDLAVGKNKEVKLTVSGEETELDRTIVNQVGDPLVHLLRNAVDHGIEMPDERRALGKSPTGNIVLEAHHEGSHVVVSVSDDGKGLDPETIRKKALEKGIISQEELEMMDDAEVPNLILRSGFSTSQAVTDISGRGVGMDVVKTAVESLNGTIEMKSEKGNGSHFVLRLPLTLAIIRALMVKAGKEIYAIPIEAIRENIYVDQHEIKTVNRGRVITLREEVLPLHSLNESLDMGVFEQQEIYPVVVVQAGNKKAGLVVEDLLGQQEIVIKSLSRYVDDIKGIAGATVLGNGRVTLILDVATLLEDGRV